MNTTNIDKQNSHLDLTNTLVQEVLSLYDEYPEAPYISPNRHLEDWLKDFHIGSESLVPKRNMIRYEEDILPGHLILLWRIEFGTFTNKSGYPKYFEYNYGINGEQALNELLEKGYATEFSAVESLHHLNAAQLKAILKQFEIGGYTKLNKTALMALVKEQMSEEQLQPLFSVRGYENTPEGKELLVKYPEPVDRHPKKKY